ncbi:MAG: D-glycero-beta-D-manno-heptose 1-phosphate adenylyltransferase [Planctomycetota bacterium]
MPTGLIDIVNRLTGLRATVVGDFMLDRYLYGTADRLSPEAPVPVLHFKREEMRLGGAGHVAADLATLGLSVDVIGVAGNDDFGRQMRETLQQQAIDTTGLVAASDRPTTSKVRLVGMAQHRTPQQMIRLDYEDAGDVDEAACKLVDDALAGVLDRGTDVVCIEDYAKGVCCEPVVRETIRRCREAGVPVLVDPPKIEDLSKYRGATCIKLNRREAQASTGLDCETIAGVEQAAGRLLEELDLQCVVITIDKDGAFLATRDGGHRLLETRARSVADVTGAGDMFLAMLAAARAAGAGWSDATALANVASGLEVERFGAQPVRPEEIVSELVHDLQHDKGKVRDADELQAELDRHRAAGRRIVFTNGCFDLVHLGHVEYFRFAKAQGDVLVVGVNTDESIRRLKGDKRPIVSLSDRLGVLSELESIDYLVTFANDTPLSLIEAIGPDVLVKGADYKKEEVVGWEIVEGRGGRIALAPLIEGRSTSTVIRKIIDAYAD